MLILINTVLGPLSVIANDTVFFEKLAVVQLKNYLVLLKFCTLRRFKAFLCDLIDRFWGNQCYLINTVLGQVNVIANDMVFTKN